MRVLLGFAIAVIIGVAVLWWLFLPDPNVRYQRSVPLPEMSFAPGSGDRTDTPADGVEPLP